MENAISTTILAIFIIFTISLITWFVLSLTKDLLDNVFPESFEDIKIFFGEPKNKFTARMVSAGKVQFRGFYANVYVFDKALIIRHLNRATMVKDVSKLKLSGKFVSTLTIENENSPIKLTLGIKEYNIIKEFLEANNG